jgi:hypothetical protein
MFPSIIGARVAYRVDNGERRVGTVTGYARGLLSVTADGGHGYYLARAGRWELAQ